MSRRPFAPARLWDYLLAGGTAPPAPSRPSEPVRLSVLPLEDRVTPDGRPLPNPLLFGGAGTAAPPIARAYRADTGVLAFE